MPARPAIAAALCAFAAAAAAIGWTAAGEIERRAAARAGMLAAAAGRAWLSVSADGLRLTLSGAAPDFDAAREALADAAAAGRWVTVLDELSLAPAPPPRRPDLPWEGTVTVTLGPEGALIEGDAANPAARARLRRAVGGAVPVVDRSAAGAAATPARWPVAAAGVEAAAEALAHGVVAVSARGLSVTGAPRDAAARAAIETAAGRLGDEGWDVTLSLSAGDGAAPAAGQAPPDAAGSDPGGPWLGASLREGRLLIRGTVPDAPTRAALLSYAAALFGPDNVEHRCAVADGPAPEGWRAAALGALDGLAALEGGQLMVRAGAVALRGVAAAGGGADAAKAALAPALGEGWRADVRVTVAPPAPAGFEPLSAAACAEALEDAGGGGALTFATGATALDPGASAALDRVAEALEACGGVSVEIGGHTDDSGPAAANRRLGQARAEAVRAALIARGADPARLGARGYGAAEPVADNATEEGRARNRRIAFRVAPEPPETP